MPSICMSPVELSMPVTVRSALMMEGAVPERPVRLSGGLARGVAPMLAGAETGSLLLENMTACLYEVAGVTHHVIIPDFVMDMGAGAAAGGPHASDRGTLFDPHAHPYGNRGKMTVACMKPHAVVDFHHVAITAPISSENNRAGGGSADRSAPGAGKIHPRMKGVAAGKGVEPGAEAAGKVEIRAVDRQRQRNMAHLLGEAAQLVQDGAALKIRCIEAAVVKPIHFDPVERDFRTTYTFIGLVLELSGVDAGALDDVAQASHVANQRVSGFVHQQGLG